MRHFNTQFLKKKKKKNSFKMSENKLMALKLWLPASPRQKFVPHFNELLVPNDHTPMSLTISTFNYFWVKQ